MPVFDAGQDGDRYYIASAYIDGKSLSDTIPDGGVPFAHAARVVRELAEALAYAHEQGIVHRDVKPQNVMLDKQNRVHLMDFGLASRQDEEARLTNDGAVMGTPAYMSPEQAKGQQGEAQPATDQYAAGVVLYELLTGQTPFAGPPAVVIANVLRVEPDPPRKRRPDVPTDLETICLKAMSKRPEDRYPDCQDLADDLRRWQEGEPITARRMGLGERAVRWARKEPKVSLAAAVVALMLVVSVALVSNAARRAEKDAADARAAEKRAEDALAEARSAREREVRVARETRGALDSATEQRENATATPRRPKRSGGRQTPSWRRPRRTARSWRRSGRNWCAKPRRYRPRTRPTSRAGPRRPTCSSRRCRRRTAGGSGATSGTSAPRSPAALPRSRSSGTARNPC